MSTATSAEDAKLEEGEEERGGLLSFGPARPQMPSPARPQCPSELLVLRLAHQPGTQGPASLTRLVEGLLGPRRGLSGPAGPGSGVQSRALSREGPDTSPFSFHNHRGPEPSASRSESCMRAASNAAAGLAAESGSQLGLLPRARGTPALGWILHAQLLLMRYCSSFLLWS